MKSKTLFYLILITFFTTLIPAMHAQTFSVIYTFTGGTDGGGPFAGVTIRGNALYGTTPDKFDNCGNMYQLTHSGSNWSFSTLATLSKGCWPEARAVFGPDGHLYSTAATSGTYGGGNVFKLTPQVGPCRDVACYWTVNDLHDFGSGSDGVGPKGADLIWDQQGNIYGTTYYGGTSNLGTVYELTPSGNGYTENVIYSFSGLDGISPSAGLIFDNKGNLFGATELGGVYGGGTVFELTYVPGVGWTEHVLYNFTGADDGALPLGSLIFDAAGNLYGTAWGGGHNGNGGGTVFELSPSGDTWTFNLLYGFSRPYYSQKCGPATTLTMDGEGNLYGTTFCDGLYDNGSVFKLSNTQNGWVYTSLHDFTGGSDGRIVASNVSIDTDGTLYGTAAYGADNNNGVVWMIKP